VVALDDVLPPPDALAQLGPDLVSASVVGAAWDEHRDVEIEHQ
jgi:hypothetical protein